MVSLLKLSLHLKLSVPWMVRITHHTVPLTLHLCGNHRESIHLLAITFPHARVVLGQPWLKLCIPHFDSPFSAVSDFSVFCRSHCLQSRFTPSKLSTSWASWSLCCSLCLPWSGWGFQHSMCPNFATSKHLFNLSQQFSLSWFNLSLSYWSCFFFDEKKDNTVIWA